MKNWFSLKLYLEGIKKVKTAGIAAAITVIALNAIIPVIAIVESNMSLPGRVRAMSTVPVSGFAPFNLMMMVFAAILVYSMFSFLNERNKCDFWHAVPHKRTCVYFSFTAAVWTWILGIIIASSLVNIILFAVAKYYIVSASTFFISIAVYFLVAIMMAAFMTLAMTITGTTVSNLLIMALLMLFVRVIGAIFIMCIEELAPMLDLNYSIWRILKFDFCLPIALLSFEAEVFSDILLLLYSTAVVIFLVILGAVGYYMRKSETATKSAPSTVMQHIYRCAVTLPLVFLIAASIITNSVDFSLVVVLIILAVLVWTIFELMTTKKFKNVLKSLPVMIVPVLVSVILSCCAFMVQNAVFSVTPDADEIEGISLGASGSRVKTYEQLRIDDLVVGNDTINTIVSDALKDTVKQVKEENKHYVSNSNHVIIHLKSGKTIGRYITMTDEEAMQVRDGFYQSEEYRKAYLSLPTTAQIDDIYFSEMDLSNNDAKRIWASFLYEYNLLDDAQKRVIKEYENTSYYYYEMSETGEVLDKETVTDGTYYYSKVGSVFISGTLGVELFQSDYPILYEYMPETAQLYLELYNEVNFTFGGGAANEVASIYDLFVKSHAEDFEEYFYGSIHFDSMCGDERIDSIGFDYSTHEKRDDQYMFDVFEVLTSLEDPENYEYAPGRTIVYCDISTDVIGKFLNEIDISEDGYAVEYDDKAAYYYHLHIPLAMTEEEADRILAVYERYYG